MKLKTFYLFAIKSLRNLLTDCELNEIRVSPERFARWSLSAFDASHSDAPSKLRIVNGDLRMVDIIPVSWRIDECQRERERERERMQMQNILKSGNQRGHFSRRRMGAIQWVNAVAEVP